MRQIYVRFNRLAVGKNVFGPDEMKMQADDGTTLSDVLMTIWNTKFLPDVRAYRVVWVALHEGRPLAVLARGLRSPVFFTNGKTLVSEYLAMGSPVFFMADLGRKDSRAVLASFSRKVDEGGDSSEAMNDVLEKYLMINRKFSGTIKIAVSAEGCVADGRGFTMHSDAKLSDAVYCVYRNGCLPEGHAQVWVMNSRRGALAVLSRGWAEGAEARYILEPEAELGMLFEEEEQVELTLLASGGDEPDVIFEKLIENQVKGPMGGSPDDFGNGLNDRFKGINF